MPLQKNVELLFRFCGDYSIIHGVAPFAGCVLLSVLYRKSEERSYSFFYKKTREATTNIEWHRKMGKLQREPWLDAVARECYNGVHAVVDVRPDGQERFSIFRFTI